MLRHTMIETIGAEYLTSNIEAGEYSYVQAAGNRTLLESKVGHPITHFKLDLRFESEDIVILIETKQVFVDSDEAQLQEYLEEEKALNPTKKTICILANTTNDKIRVWKSYIDSEHLLSNEQVLDKMEHYAHLFRISKSNDRETVLKNTEDEANSLMEKVRKEHIYGIEVEEKAYGLSTTNMLIHGDGNSNIKFDSCFNCKDFIKTADPDIILMNPPYNAKPIGIPDTYKVNWGKAKDGKEDPTKGLVFVHYLSDIVEEMNVEREVAGKARKTVKMAVLLPVAAAIGNKNIIQSEKIALLENNTLEAVFTLPNEIFYPGASASACCMVFTLGEPHIRADGTLHETFFGYFKEDGFKKKKYLGRVEQFDENGNSKWKAIEEEWLDVFRNHLSKDGLSATAKVTGEDEWLCEAYMKTDYTTLREDDFQQTLNNYLAYLLKEGKIYES